MSHDRYRWAQLAQDLRFHQLEAVRRQAESWRTGLTGLTALFGAVLVLKGRDNLADLPRPYPAVIVGLLLAALTFFVVATLSALRGASGTPGDECLLTGEDLEQWTRGETSAAQRAIRWARRLTLVGAAAMAVAVGLAWLAPARPARGPMVVVRTADGPTCGGLVSIADGSIAVRQGSSVRIISLARVSRVDYASTCPR